MGNFPKRTYWVEDNRYSLTDYAREKIRRQVSEADGYLVSSLCESGRHAPVLDFDFSVEVSENILIFSKLVTVDKAYGLFEALAECGFIGENEKCSVGLERFTLRDYHEKIPFSFSVKLDAPFRLIASSTAGHCHLYIDREVSWLQYKKLLVRFTEAGLIEGNYYRLCAKHEKGFLLKPGVTKDDIREMQKRGTVSHRYFVY